MSQWSSCQLATTTATGGRTAATADIAMAAPVEKKRTTFQASTMRVTQTPMIAKYQRLRDRWRSLRPGGTSVTLGGLSRRLMAPTVLGPVAPSLPDLSHLVTEIRH